MAGPRAGLVAAAGPDHHVPVLLQDDVGAVVEVEDGNGVELSRGAARLGHRLRVDEVDLEHTPKRWWLRPGIASAWPPRVCWDKSHGDNTYLAPPVLST